MFIEVTHPITADVLRKLLSYNPDTGGFIWIGRTGKGVKIGSNAGRVDRRGYRGINIGNRKYAEHRLAWLYVYGKWPENQIDHINRDPADNRISNLRDVSGSINCQNREYKARRWPKGVCQIKNGKWQVQICVPGSGNKYLGVYGTVEEAHCAYEAERALL